MFCFPLSSLSLSLSLVKIIVVVIQKAITIRCGNLSLASKAYSEYIWLSIPDRAKPVQLVLKERVVKQKP